MIRAYYDSHIHSTFSCDGKSAVEEYSALIDAGILQGIGFAEHVDLMPECGSYEFLDHGQYLKEIQHFRDRGYEFYAGGEVDYAKKAEQEIKEHLKRYRYAFTICSVHMIDGVSISDRVFIPSLKDRNELMCIIEKYYSELKLSLNAGIFDVIGHIGVYKRHLGDIFHGNSKIKGYVKEAEYEMARICAQSDMILEVNTSGLFSPLAQTLPGEAFLKLYYYFGGRTVCIGSDAHTSADAGKGIETAYSILQQTGFDYITLPWDRENPVRIK